jgi:DNA-binding response OmpR family regulator
MRKVLIVHNPGPLTDILSDHLRGNYEVTVCHTGAEAITLIDRLRPDILILYLSLPDIDGITVLHHTGYMPDVVLALTNLATDKVLQAAFDAGAQDVILIPAPIHYIVSRMEHLMKRAPSLEA